MCKKISWCFDRKNKKRKMFYDVNFSLDFSMKRPTADGSKTAFLNNFFKGLTVQNDQ